MKILVINAGSSSLKYQLIDMENESVVAKGICERIGMNDGIFSHKTFDGREKNLTTDMEDHTQAFQLVKDALIDSKVGVDVYKRQALQLPVRLWLFCVLQRIWMI